jgi:hypothetical protein
MPREPPVTNATLPARFFVIMWLLAWMPCLPRYAHRCVCSAEP